MNDADRVREERRAALAELETANRQIGFQWGFFVGMITCAAIVLGGWLLWIWR